MTLPHQDKPQFSICCKSGISVVGDTTKYYRCDNCGKPCDAYRVDNSLGTEPSQTNDDLLIKICQIIWGSYAGAPAHIVREIKEALDAKDTLLAESEARLRISVEGAIMATNKVLDLQSQVEKLDKLAYMEGEPGHETTWKEEAEALFKMTQKQKAEIERQKERGEMNKEKILSSCCKSPVVVSGGDEGTFYYSCSKCLKPCDMYSEFNKHNASQKAMTPPDWKKKFASEFAGNYGYCNPYWARKIVEFIESLLAHQRQEVLEEAIQAVRKHTDDGLFPIISRTLRNLAGEKS